jgi:hypothetical protein
VVVVTFLEFLGIAFLLSFALIAFLFVSAHRRARRPRLVACPETQTPELLSLDAVGTARSDASPEGKPALASCTGWPERALCARGCLEEIESASSEGRFHEPLAKCARTAGDVLAGLDSFWDRSAFPLRDGKRADERRVAW